MTTKRVSRLVLVAGLVLSSRVSQAQQKLEAFADIVAGSGESFSNNCGSVGPTPQLSFFTFKPQLIKPGGFVTCGYAQSSLLTNTQNGGVGPLTNSNSLSGVPLGGPLGPPGGVFDGTANSTASYGSLGATAHANVNSATGLPNNGAAMFETVGAATFSDLITATSPIVASLSAGFVRYKFAVNGVMSALGVQAPFFFGDTYMVLDVQQDGGTVNEVTNAHTTRGSNGLIRNQAPPAGWTAGVGSLTGGSTFFSLFLPMTWGVQWNVKVGLLAWAYGTADANFVAKITGVELYDANQNAVTTFALNAASGVTYPNLGGTNPVTTPEPSTLLLGAIGLIALGVARRVQHGSA